MLQFHELPQLLGATFTCISTCSPFHDVTYMADPRNSTPFNFMLLSKSSMSVGLQIYWTQRLEASCLGLFQHHSKDNSWPCL